MWAARALLLELHPLSASHYTHPLQVWAAYVLLLEQSTPGLDPGLGYQSALALLLREYAEAVGLAGTVVIPFDKSLQEGRAFHYDALHPATVRAYEEATATLTDQL